MKLYKVKKIILLSLCISAICILIILVFSVLFLESKFNEVVIQSGTNDSEYIQNHYSMILPKNTLYINHYSESSAWQSSELYMRIKLNMINHEQELLDDLVNISGYDTAYMKGSDVNNVDIPLGKGISWWNPELLSNLEYYESTNDHHNMLFWIDRNNNYIYLFDSD